MIRGGSAPALGSFGPCGAGWRRRTVRTMRTRTRIAVIGVGNEFRRDDGVGWAVLARLRERAGQRPLPPGTALATCDGDPGRLIGLWEGADLAVVVDAAHAHPGVPGRVHRLELDNGLIAQPQTTSSHGLGLGEAVELARVLGVLPVHLVVYAVEGAESALGNGLSPAVQDAVEPLVRAVESELARHRETAARRPA
ncbi:hydrogenase maturation protease [Streptomyces sp. TLI_185]|nr:hydrogenase maturation protease [Streptomyces sp. TLI_185]